MVTANCVGMGSANPNARLQATGPNQMVDNLLMVCSNAGAGDDNSD